jgi:hypothetical protein
VRSAASSSIYAKDVKGKLMFIHGLMDSGCHPAALFQLIQALMNENKDFDLVLQPQAGHELGGWAQRRQWDFFVQHLAGVQPPPPVAHKSAADIMKEKMMKAMGPGEEPKKDEAKKDEGEVKK